MTREIKNYHDNFVKYMSEIIKHENYRGLARKQDSNGYGWVAGKQTEIGQERLNWANKKLQSLGEPIEAGCYARLMLQLHPTKKKPCQICGREMSLYYEYPNKKFIEYFKKKYDYDYQDGETLKEVIHNLIELGNDLKKLKWMLIQKGHLKGEACTTSLETLLEKVEIKCRLEGLKLCGPGAMSNFPDRFDGFHSYNRCCRSIEDKGRSEANLRSYTQDRRAYEYFSDGNIAAANQFMGSKYFKGQSADHIGPISLGFVHDPLYIQRMSKSENSAKRDRLYKNDISKIIDIETKTGVPAISWFAAIIWQSLKNNITKLKEIDLEYYSKAFKRNICSYMHILNNIISRDGGADFVIKYLIKPKLDNFNYKYSFDMFGHIIARKDRKFSDNNKDEIDRIIRISLESIKNFNSKDNRNVSPIDLNKIRVELNNFYLAMIQGEHGRDICEKFKLIINKVQYIILDEEHLML